MVISQADGNKGNTEVGNHHSDRVSSVVLSVDIAVQHMLAEECNTGAALVKTAGASSSCVRNIETPVESWHSDRDDQAHC